MSASCVTRRVPEAPAGKHGHAEFCQIVFTKNAGRTCSVNGGAQVNGRNEDRLNLEERLTCLPFFLPCTDERMIDHRK